jgi:hypothetical protein
MKVHLIKEQAERYISYLENTEEFSELYKYESLDNFRKHWDLNASDFYEMFDNSFRSGISNRLWGGSVNSAKSAMLKFIELNTEFVRSMFVDLFNENKDLSMRINRFALHCDEMLTQLPNTKDRIVDHRHGPQIISLYLCFHDPENYTIVNYRAFYHAMELLGNQNIPQAFELERAIKLSRGLYKILGGYDALESLYQKWLPDKYFDGLNMLAVHDFFQLMKKFQTH